VTTTEMSFHNPGEVIVGNTKEGISGRRRRRVGATFPGLGGSFPCTKGLEGTPTRTVSRVGPPKRTIMFIIMMCGGEWGNDLRGKGGVTRKRTATQQELQKKRKRAL